MNTIAFIDTEIDPETRKVLDIGSIRSDEYYMELTRVNRDKT